MKKLIILVLISGFFFCTKSIAKEYTIGVENLDYLPYYSGINDEYKGYAKELLDAFGEKKGYTFKYKTMPVRRLFKSLLNESVDFKFPDNPYWQGDMKKEKAVLYSETVVKTLDGVMVIPKRKGKGIDELKILGTVMGFTPWPYKEMIDKGKIKVSENSNFQGLIRQVIKGRVSGAFLNPVVTDYQLNNILKMPGKLVYDPELPFNKSDYLLSTIKHQVVIDSFNKFLTENKDFIQRLKDKYGIVEEP